MTIITAEHLSKWYGQVSALNDVTVSVPPGITGLLGPNGAGKSTFMKLVTGQLKPSQGSVTVLGEPIWANPGIYVRIGFCPEQDAFYETMTANILLIDRGRILAEGNVHQIRALIDTHPHTVFIRARDPRALARRLLAEDDVLSLRFEQGAVIVETATPDAFYARLTALAA